MTDHDSAIIQQFAQAGYQIDPNALSILLENDSSPGSINTILDSLDKSVLVVGPEHIRTGLSQIVPLESSAIPDISSSECFPTPVKDPDYEDELTWDLDVISDITDQSTCVGEIGEFVDYFRNRFTRLSDLLRNRGVGFRPVESLSRSKTGMVEGREEVSVIGMVSDIRTSKNGHRMIEIEDTTGTFRTMVLKKNKDLFDQAMKVMLDEVIGLTGSLSDDGNLLFINNLMWPDIPVRNSTELGEPDNTGLAVLISDIHVGSDTFLEDEWLAFIEWLNGGTNAENNGSIDVRDIKYLVVAGDLVDGIGIYPDQDKELSISDVYDQYRKAAEYFEQIPGHIKVIISPGNHDIVRQAEPQPAFPDTIKKMFRPDVVFVGNPAVISMDGVRTLIYHGRSIDDIIATLPGMKYEDPAKPMIEMLKRRHLSPIYGSKVSIAPEKVDHLLIDRIPDILHCGHVHTVGCTNYRGVTVINSGTWQSQTSFQRRMNLQPEPARAAVVNLGTKDTKIISFL
ncbi:MAG: DNA-directed DNA polymerase II small subunit [ANME-2 cluster archaeon]|nr:DNA-directed DNA polymerase II small subunit [ANME-2 cluster archaeon]